MPVEFLDAYPNLREWLRGGTVSTSALRGDVLEVIAHLDRPDDAIHIPDHGRVNRTLCGQPLGVLSVQSSPPDGAAGCWSCLQRHAANAAQEGSGGRPMIAECKHGLPLTVVECPACSAEAASIAAREAQEDQHGR